jgi:signal transduction histidine kinase
MPVGHWIESPQRLLVLFLVVMLAIAGALGWLGWRLFEQDREISRQNIEKGLNSAAETAAAVIARKLSEIESSLGLPAGAVQREDFVAVTFTPERIEPQPSHTLLYFPVVPSTRTETPRVFDPGLQAGFQDDHVRAAAIFRQIANTSERPVRAQALTFAASSLVKAGATDEALAIYADVSQLEPTLAQDGLYLDLAARARRIELLLNRGQRSLCEQEGAELYDALLHGRWSLTPGRWKKYREAVSVCFQPNSAAQAEENAASARAAGVEWLWQTWQRIRKNGGDSSGREALWVGGRPVVVIWRGSPERLTGAVGGSGFIESDWGAALRQIGTDYRFSISDREGRVAWGTAPVLTASQSAARSLADAHIPWSVRAELADPGSELARLESRRRWLLAGLALAGALILTGGFLVARTFARELEVARLQSDFVSAVSHDFRTPLSSLRQASELLAEGRVSGEERRQGYYEALRSQTERLQRLVEDLLDFRQWDAGIQQFAPRNVSIEELVRDVVDEFQERTSEERCPIDIAVVSPLPLVLADRQALGRALRNLLDNAIKYSPESKTVRVDLKRDGNRVAIAVHDRGIGIAPRDQKKIFKKFVRAEAAKSAGIKGTGIGLTMAHQIVLAHRGRIVVESRAGAGSTFTIVLPSLEEAAAEPAERPVGV